jgi:uncharacterized membrane protein (UPF0127 family)
MTLPSIRVSFGIILLIAFAISFVVLQLFTNRFPTAVIQIGEKKVYVQIANTIGRQYTGLGGREQLLPYGGMVFPYVPARRVAIVMRDMQFPIDIIWVRSGKVIDIAPNVQPEPNVPEERLTVYNPRLPADMVIELKAGFTEEYGVQIGDSVQVIDG